MANNAIILDEQLDPRALDLVLLYLFRSVGHPLTPPTGRFLDAGLAEVTEMAATVETTVTNLVRAAVEYAAELTTYTQQVNGGMLPQPYEGNLGDRVSAFRHVLAGLSQRESAAAVQRSLLLCSTIALMEEANVAGWVELDYLLGCVQSLNIRNEWQLRLNLEGHYLRFASRSAHGTQPARAIYDVTVAELDATYKMALVLDQFFPRLERPDDGQLTAYEKDSLFTKVARGPVGHIIGDAVRERLRGAGWFPRR